MIPATVQKIKKDMAIYVDKIKAGPPRARVWPEPTKRPVPIVPPKAIIWACLSYISLPNHIIWRTASNLP